MYVEMEHYFLFLIANGGNDYNNILNGKLAKMFFFLTSRRSGVRVICDRRPITEHIFFYV